MPANLTPMYREAEDKYKAASTPLEKLKALRQMLAIIPKHKGTEKMQADIKGKIKKYQEEVETKGKSSSRKPVGQHVKREGAGQILLLGPANGGKSAIVKSLTRAEPEVAPYPFTTRILGPAMMAFKNIQVQLVDAPAMSREAMEAWMVNSIRYADAILVVVDVCADDPADSVKGIVERLAENRLHLVREASEVKEEDDVLFDSRMAHKRTLVAANKMDLDEADFWLGEFEEALAMDLPIFPVSAETGLGLEPLRDALFRILEVIRVYTRAPGKVEKRDEPFTLARGSTVSDLAREIHREMAKDMKQA
ncbi:MAG: GTPase, partial [Planctomycetota bacterium]